MTDHSQQKQGLVARFASKYHIQPDKLMDILKATAFKQRDSDPPVSNEQMAALLIVADQYNLNPFTREIYAFPDKNNGIVPVVGVDGWARIINEHPQFDGLEFSESTDLVQIDEDAKICPAWIKCIIYRKDRGHPTRIPEYLDECYRPAFTGMSRKNNRPYKIKGHWQTHTKRALRHKALIQAARVAFSFAGIYDQDEAERILEGQSARVAPAIDGAVIGHTPELEAPATTNELNNMFRPAEQDLAPGQAEPAHLEPTSEPPVDEHADMTSDQSDFLAEMDATKTGES